MNRPRKPASALGSSASSPRSALTLACLGIYGVIAYLVTQRYKEIGIRMALGATRANLLQLMLGRTLKLTALGIVAGFIADFFLSRFLSSILFGITAHAVIFIAVPLCLSVIALLAGYLPARRAHPRRSRNVVALRIVSRIAPKILG